MTKLLIIGAGGHARVLVEALKAVGKAPVGFVTLTAEQGSGVMRGIERLGSDDDLLALGPEGVTLVNGIGSMGRQDARRSAFVRFKLAGFGFASVVHPSAIVACDVLLGEGAQIMAGAVLQPGVRVGRNAIINTGAIVDHDSDIGDHAHLASGACLAGSVTVGACAHVGARAAVIQNMHIGANAIVGAGAAVVRDVEPDAVVMGVPARAKQ